MKTNLPPSKAVFSTVIELKLLLLVVLPGVIFKKLPPSYTLQIFEDRDYVIYQSSLF